MHLNICFLSLHIHTVSKGYQSTFLTFKQSFHIPTNFKKVCDILYFHTFWSNFHLMLEKRTFDHPLVYKCPRAVCRINAINACIVYICTPVFQFSNCRIFCFFYRLFTVGLQEFAKKIMVDHSNLLIAGPLSWRPGNYHIYLFTTILLTRSSNQFWNFWIFNFSRIFLPIKFFLFKKNKTITRKKQKKQNLNP